MPHVEGEGIKYRPQPTTSNVPHVYVRPLNPSTQGVFLPFSLSFSPSLPLSLCLSLSLFLFLFLSLFLSLPLSLSLSPFGKSDTSSARRCACASGKEKNAAIWKEGGAAEPDQTLGLPSRAFYK